MRAELQPLTGRKYYGTEVSITDDDWGNFHGRSYDGFVSIWVMGNYEPSRRELEGYEKRDGKWMRWEPEEEYKGRIYPGEWVEYEISDSHYETETSLEIAELLVEAINAAHGR